MKKNRANEIKVGIVSISGIILLLFILYFTKNFTFGEKTISVLFEFDNALGMNIDSPVFVNGVKKGIVDKIWLNNGKVLVSTKLEDIDDLKEDCCAEIQILELTGGKKIEITPGSALENFNPKNIITGKNSLDLGSAITKLGDISNDLVLIISKVDTLLSTSIGIIKDPNINKIVNNTAEATATLNNIINDSRINKTIDNLANISNDLNRLIIDNKDGINRIANNFDTSSTEIVKMIYDLQGTIKDSRTTLSKLNDFIDDFKQSDGTIGKLMYDTTLANKIVNTIDTLDALILQIKKKGLTTNIRLGW